MTEFSSLWLAISLLAITCKKQSRVHSYVVYTKIIFVYYFNIRKQSEMLGKNMVLILLWYIVLVIHYPNKKMRNLIKNNPKLVAKQKDEVIFFASCTFTLKLFYNIANKVCYGAITVLVLHYMLTSSTVTNTPTTSF